MDWVFEPTLGQAGETSFKGAHIGDPLWGPPYPSGSAPSGPPRWAHLKPVFHLLAPGLAHTSPIVTPRHDCSWTLMVTA